MEKTSRERAEGARRSAEQRITRTRQREEVARQALSDLEVLRRSEDAKTMRLRKLRHAKEESDRKAAAQATDEKAAKTAAGKVSAMKPALAKSGVTKVDA